MARGGILRRDRVWRSLRARLLVGVLIGLLPIALLLTFLWMTGRERERQAALVNLSQTAEAVAVVTDGLFDAALVLGHTVATDPSVRTLDPDRFVPHLRQIGSRAPQFSNIIVLDASGRILGWSAPDALPQEFSAADRPHFQQAMSAGQPSTIWALQSMRVGIISGGVAVPIFAADSPPGASAPIGVVAVNFAADEVSTRLSRVRLFPGQIINLIDPTGRVAVQVGRLGDATPLSWDQRDRSQLTEFQAAVAGQIVTRQDYRSPMAAPDTGEPRLAIFLPTPRYGWVVSTSWPVSEALGPARQAEQRELTIFLTIALLLLGGALFLSASLVAPLRRLADHTRTLGEGRFEPIPDAHADDEIGELTVTFNLMGERLQHTLSELRRERGQLQAILQNLPVGVVIRGEPDGRLLLSNPQAAEIWQQPLVTDVPTDQSPAGRGFHSDGRPYADGEWPIRRSLATGEVIRGEVIPILRADETEAVILVSSAPIRDDQGQIVAAVASMVDVTVQHQQDTLLREREELLRALLDQFPASVAVIDRDLRYVLAAGRRLLETGHTPAQLVGRSLDELYSPELVAEARAHANRAFAGETVSYDIAEQGVCLHVTMQPLRDGRGDVEHVLSVSFDITEERARLDLAVRDEKLHALGQMAGGIAHNLNQMLALVSGYGELVRDHLDGGSVNHSELMRMIRIIERAAYDGGETVKRLLTFARGQGSESHQIVDIPTLLHEVQQLTAPRWRDACQTEGRPVDLSVQTEPGITVLGSQAGLREAVTNLVFNAIDAMPCGGTIRLSARRDGEQVLVEVADSGTGMTADVGQKIFEPFFTTKGEQGTGLGLAMVFGIVRQHGGQIDVTSAPGQGTTMHLRLPAGAPEQAAAEAEQVQPTSASLRVLVVDDEMRLAMLAAGMLRRDGHEVVEAFSGEEALERIRAEQPDLLITDLSMGEGMNGWELAAAASSIAPGLPVVLATGWGASIDEDEARNRGVTAVLAKPFRIAELRAAVARVTAA